MKITLKEISVADLAKGYMDNSEDGVIGYDGKLDIRPPYQREFIYNDKQRDAVIDTLTKDFPLNVMYWAVRDDGTFEVIDGQQRTISICQYVNKDFSFKSKYFHNLQNDEQEQVLNYKLMVYICEGEDSKKLEWFKTINIAGEKRMMSYLKWRFLENKSLDLLNKSRHTIYSFTFSNINSNLSFLSIFPVLNIS